jgi:hypothetical protein
MYGSNSQVQPPQRKLKVGKLKPKITQKAKAMPAAQPLSDEDDSVPITESENEESLLCGFCISKYLAKSRF